MHQGSEPIPGYRVDRLLGRGGFGEVWRARGPGQTPVALKFVNLCDKPGLREWRAVQRVKEIRHAHLLPVHGLWVLDARGRVLRDDEVAGVVPRPGPRMSSDMAVGGGGAATLIIAMTLADGSLGDRLEHHRREDRCGIPRPELLRYAEDAARAIDFLNSPRHDLGHGPVAIQHCDIKPQNILLLADCACVADFGLLKLFDESAPASSLHGTPAYIAPERLRGEGGTATTDQYSLAITLYQLLTGRLPFKAVDYVEIFQAHLEHRLEFEAVSQRESEVLHRATAVDPQARYPTASELVAQLRNLWVAEDGLGQQREPAAYGRFAEPPDRDLGRRGRTGTHTVTVGLHDAPDAVSGVVEQRELQVSVTALEESCFRFTLQGGADGQARSYEANLSPRVLEHLRNQMLAVLGRTTSVPETLLGQLGRYAFRVLLPEPVQSELRAHAGRCRISCSSADVPWELLHDGQRFLAIQTELMRTSQVEREQPAPTTWHGRRVLLLSPFEQSDAEARREASELQHVWDRYHLGCERVENATSASLLHVIDLLASGGFDLVHLRARDRVDANTGDYLISLGDGLELTLDEFRQSLHGHALVGLHLTPATPWHSPEDMRQHLAARLHFAESLGQRTGSDGLPAVIMSVWQGRPASGAVFFPEFYERILAGTALRDALALTRARLRAGSDDARAAFTSAGWGRPDLVHQRSLTAAAAPAEPRSVVEAAGPLEPLLAGLLRGTRFASTGATSTSLQLALLTALSIRRTSAASCLGLQHLWLGMLRVPRGALAELVRTQKSRTAQLQALLERVSEPPGKVLAHPGVPPVTQSVGMAFHRAARIAAERGAAVLTDALLLEAMLATECPATALVRQLLRGEEAG